MDFCHDGQPQSGMALVLSVAAPEPLEDELALRLVDAGAAILDPDCGGRSYLDFHALIGMRVADSIFHQIAHGAQQHLGIAKGPDRIMFSRKFARFVLGQRDRRHQAHYLLRPVRLD